MSGRKLREEGGGTSFLFDNVKMGSDLPLTVSRPCPCPDRFDPDSVRFWGTLSAARHPRRPGPLRRGPLCVSDPVPSEDLSRTVPLPRVSVYGVTPLSLVTFPSLCPLSTGTEPDVVGSTHVSSPVPSFVNRPRKKV